LRAGFDSPWGHTLGIKKTQSYLNEAHFGPFFTGIRPNMLESRVIRAKEFLDIKSVWTKFKDHPAVFGFIERDEKNQKKRSIRSGA